VKCLGVDEKGRVRLSRRAAMEERDQDVAAKEKADYEAKHGPSGDSGNSGGERVNIAAVAVVVIATAARAGVGTVAVDAAVIVEDALAIAAVAIVEATVARANTTSARRVSWRREQRGGASNVPAARGRAFPRRRTSRTAAASRSGVIEKPIYARTRRSIRRVRFAASAALPVAARRQTAAKFLLAIG